jgi:hydrophobe/amphiphile efflux-1 (HAE1) family protein
MNFSEPFIRRPIATSLAMAAVVLAGIAAFPLLPVAPLPQVDFPTIQVTATLAGASPETMASSVAAPLERQLGQLADVTQMTSFSALGATSITIQFDLGRNIDSGAQDVQAAINAASRTLPQSMTTPPIFRKLNPAETPILILSVQSDALPLTVVDDYADNFLAQQISEVPGVAQVSIGGEQKPSIRVQIDPAPLASRGLTLEDVRSAIVAATTNAAKGALTTRKTTFTIAVNDQITEPEQFDDVIIAYRNGAPVRVRDVGHAISAAADRSAAAFPNNRPGLLLSVSKQPGANIIETVDLIKAQLPQLTANIPPAVTVETILDRTVTIRAAVRDVGFTLALTIGLVVLVVLLFLRDLWAALIPGVVVLSLLGSFAIMYALNFSLDNISLMGLTIATGFVVDDAIVVVENIYRHIERGALPFEAALAGSREIAFTVLSISLSLVAVFIPLLLMGGIVGRVFREFSVTVGAAISVSALVSLTLAPVMCSRFIRINPETHGRLYHVIEDAFVSMLSAYKRTLDIVLSHRRITLGVFFIAIGLTIEMGIYIPKGFFPIQDTGIISGLAEAGQGVSPEEMMRLQRRLGEVIGANPNVAGFASWTGSTGGNGNAQTANTARFFIALKPREERGFTASQIIDRLRPEIARVPGVKLFLSPGQDITVGGRSSRGSFQYTLHDSNIAELVHWSQKMLGRMRALPEIADAATDLLADAPQIKITINRDQAGRFGISPQLIDDTLDDAYGQRQITQYFTQLNTYPVILELPLELQNDFSSLDRIYLKSPLTGAAVPLGVLVTRTSEVGPLSVTHQGLFPAVTLSFNLRPGVSLGQAVDAISRSASDIAMPSSVVGTFEGNAQAFQTSLSSMPILIIGAVIVVYVILGILYESYIHPLTILSTLPPAGVGALLALHLGHMDLSVIGVTALILLIGIVKKNGIMLVDFAIVAERERQMSPVDAIREACLLRFRPILMTTAAALLAGVPLALGNGTGSELRRPLGYAMVGGLIFTQLLTLYTTPVIYLYLDRLQIWLTGERTARSNWAGEITAAKKVRPVPMAEVGPGLSPGRHGEGTPD